jgi:cell division cycle 2-like protein
VTELELLDNFCTILGTPNEANLPGFSLLPGVKELKSIPSQPLCRLRERVPGLSETGFDLMSRFLTYDPACRLSASEALKHAYFTEAPLPVTSFKPALDVVYESPASSS